MVFFLLGYYILDFSMGVVCWTTNSLYNGIMYLNKKKPNIEDEEFILIQNIKDINDIRKELREIKALIKST
tara:strand:+ start:1793 stop:2005 length:213 start_codon:yes stop_codon:yes gene_type:complete